MIEQELSFMQFDTHQSFKKIIQAGFSEAQAEAIINLVRDSKEYDLSKLTTKEQVALFLKKMLNKKSGQLESSLQLLA